MHVDKIIVDEGGCMCCPGGTEFPAEAAEGNLFYRTDEKQLYQYNGAVWIGVENTMDIKDATNLALTALLGGRPGGQIIRGGSGSEGNDDLYLYANIGGTPYIILRQGAYIRLESASDIFLDTAGVGKHHFRGPSDVERMILDGSGNLNPKGNITMESLKTVDGIDISLIPSVYQALAEKDQASGYVGLDGSGLINPAQLPSIAIIDVFEVASEIEQLALTIQKGDVAVRSDENKSYINKTGDNVSMADWTLLQTPTDVVLSAFGRVGVITAQNGDYTANQITNVPAGNIEAVTTQLAIDELDTEKEPVIAVKGDAFNKDFGVVAGTVCQGDDSRLKTRSPSRQVVWCTFSGLLGGNQTIFAHIGGDPAITATEAKAQIRMPKCNLKAIEGYCYHAASDCILTVRKNGIGTALTGTVDATGRFRFTDSIAFADGDLFSLEQNVAAGGGTGFNGIAIEADVELV